MISSSVSGEDLEKLIHTYEELRKNSKLRHVRPSQLSYVIWADMFEIKKEVYR